MLSIANIYFYIFASFCLYLLVVYNVLIVYSYSRSTYFDISSSFHFLQVAWFHALIYGWVIFFHSFCLFVRVKDSAYRQGSINSFKFRVQRTWYLRKYKSFLQSESHLCSDNSLYCLESQLYSSKYLREGFLWRSDIFLR